MSKLTPHVNDLTVAAEKGRSQFYKAILYAGIFLIIALLAALLLLTEKGRQMLPGRYNPHPTSEMQPHLGAVGSLADVA